MPIPNETDRPNRTLLRDRVQEQIREAILDGTLQPGERLRDDDLISWLGASRTPVREALTTLAQEGLIEMVPNRYTRIALPTSEQAAHAVRALGVLMGGIVRITVPVLTVAQRRVAAARIAATIKQLRTGGTCAIVYTVDDGYQTWLDLCPNLCSSTSAAAPYRDSRSRIGSTTARPHPRRADRRGVGGRPGTDVERPRRRDRWAPPQGRRGRRNTRDHRGARPRLPAGTMSTTNAPNTPDAGTVRPPGSLRRRLAAVVAAVVALVVVLVAVLTGTV